MSGGFIFTNVSGPGNLNVTTPVLDVTTQLPPVVPNVTDTTLTSLLNGTTPGANILHCPEIGVKSGWYDERLQVSTRSRDVGTTVEISCKEGSKLRGPSFLHCRENGLWNGTQPHCEGISQVGLPMSTLLFIGVLTGCCALVVLVVVIIVCRFVCCSKSKKSDSGSSGVTTTDTSDRESNSPYYAVHVLNRNRSVETGSVHYAKPEVYSSFVNPGFYEDVYARWRSREELSERVYDSPWFVKFGRIPRAQVTEDEIQDTEELTTF